MTAVSITLTTVGVALFVHAWAVLFRGVSGPG